MRSNPRVLAIVLAGGEGKRLMPLTQDRAKPAVPFGGTYRLIDFSLSNIVNSGYLKIVVLTQYKSHSLDRHISKTWRMSSLLGNYVSPVPAQQRVSKEWFSGSADAIFQSLNILDDERPDYVLITGADNIYRMDFSQMVRQHIDTGVGMTISGIRQPIEMSTSFGVIDTDPNNSKMVRQFLEKPAQVDGLPDSPNEILASMGNYVVTADALYQVLHEDADNLESKHDMGGDIVPKFVENGDCGVYDFTFNDVPGSTERDRNYWRDVGTIDMFHEANMDLISVNPIFNLYNDKWPLYTGYTGLPPAKFVYGHRERLGHALDSIIAPGVIISGGEVLGSVLSPHVRVNSWSSVRDSVLFDGVNVGRNATVVGAILDKYVQVDEGAQVGIDHEHDRARGFHISDGGIVVVPKGMRVTMH
ncbi:glucose-1-phosphate adenylyltransferase [Trueperella sp. HMSC08B05]|uniref:Glucose-1-phosphate adenylyltransferase n=2 Tax=Trueperella bernardiae TaxID=59561 RepID=A0AAW6ZHJ6_9ACTO|nr:MULTISPECIES: glucose-1-phosphate adenylyltransferase [Trueperella]MDK8601182.1 glucose-1-phosphate adenylyltransferase [Trueperella bernardiae]MDV6238015.1 glucose-1-phosphate adenylyltransferase [Trueperella bernardiae]OCW59852.1 glucose-1-phosphate adenylyltransferase [Trueperella bernardiae]OFS68502.1 glucose-1-phosphate adenylyltransferase [Trueperella sp. HMSC08H06]OFS76118.1 glucose-1-phosphate adenylyltransferase [Trueperella sp. HMSC08B05]